MYGEVINAITNIRQSLLPTISIRKNIEQYYGSTKKKCYLCRKVGNSKWRIVHAKN